MDQKNFLFAEQLINSSYVRLGQNSINKRQKIMKQLLSQRQLPQKGLDNLTIRYFLDTFALMDSNNFDQKIGVGQRESRIFSSMVQQRHYYMGHGIGRSGDVMANQPKAAGSSLILQLTKYLIISALKQLNYEFVNNVLLLPLATGMSLSMSLLTLAGEYPNKKYVIWSRIDQKTCLKSIETANLIPIVIQLEQDGDSLKTNLQQMKNKIQQIGSQKILAIISTTSCFAPRVPDDVEEISIIAKKYHLFHIVNNAYGIWCTKIANKIKQSLRKGECTIVVQSTDKNFLVPVGGSIIFAKDNKILQKISQKYPGRANGSPILDLFITLLQMGKQTILRLKKQRKQNYNLFLEKGKQFAEKHSFKILSTPNNSISIAMQIDKLLKDVSVDQLTELGAILFSKRVMGHRIIVEKQKITKICQLKFKNYGSHSQNYQHLPYITFACAVGTQKTQIDLFFKRLQQSIKQLLNKIKKNRNKITNLIQKTQKIQINEQKNQSSLAIQQKIETKSQKSSI